MTIREMSVADMTERLMREGARTQHFTWVIGAGFSASAGIPVAAGITRRIAAFEYMLDTNERVSLDASGTDSRTLPITDYTQSFDDFLKWYALKEVDQDSEFERIASSATEWAKGQPAFRDTDLASAHAYSALFAHYLSNPLVSKHVITSLVTQGRGSNVAHTLLAFLLTSHFGIQHTVFTTNFDDLLVGALTRFGTPARVFGDLNMLDKPDTGPDHPQIVHLHGRHASYAVRNTGEQITHPSLEFQSSFREHLRHSSLIVIGYSGWDDLITSVLAEWARTPGLIRGNLYWIPFRSRAGLTEEAKQILEAAPEGRAIAVVDPDEDLDADTFMFRFCRGLKIDPSQPFAMIRDRYARLQTHLDHQWRAIQEHEQSASKGPPTRVATKPPSPSDSLSPTDYFEVVLPTILRWKGKAAIELNATIAFDLYRGNALVGDADTRYYVVLREPEPRVEREWPNKPDLVIKITTPQMQAILDGGFDARRAIADGEIELYGDLELLKAVGEFFQG